MTRPDCIAHWSEIEGADDSHYEGDDELMSVRAAFGRHFGLKRLGINHERLPPGRRTSYPHAESTEEEFVYVLAGEPEVWLDGVLTRLKPGDGVGFPPGTGQCHTFINNTDAEVRLLVVGDTARADNKVLYPLNPDRKAYREDLWTDAPARAFGAHDGLPDAVRARKGKAGERG
ncbi:cupin domain-containing protein [uncultured Alsobacter sp.]|uniref:cupin domain-containing protein n=1 Tax=uncultured Alsobacter sp. TaxID=1748258 RepID=UPI0025D9368C|nr:cupin domain-containing protein [uncultured Alsobacter sp.]